MFDLKLALILSGGGVGLLTLALGLYLQASGMRASRKVRRNIEEQLEKVTLFEERLRSIEMHAVDYMLSLGPDGRRTLDRLRTILGSQRDILGEIYRFLPACDQITRNVIANLLDSEVTGFRSRKPGDPRTSGTHFRIVKNSSSDGEKRAALINYLTENVGWHREAEELLQKLGSEIGRASVQADKSGLPKRNQKFSTLNSLKKAGIRSAFQNRS